MSDVKSRRLHVLRDPALVRPGVFAYRSVTLLGPADRFRAACGTGVDLAVAELLP